MSDTLFYSNLSTKEEPLAARMRPRALDEYVGQQKIVGKGRLLRRAIRADRLSSVIFYGPPGTGKTTLARVIANHTKSNFLSLNAVLSGVQQIRDSIKTAEENKKLYSRKTILFVDEVHRWNKAQQDALLPWVENGTIVLIGATTENPFFEVNKALVSRSRVFRLETLEQEDLLKIAKQAIADKERGYGNWNVKFENGALEHLVKTASGDARSLLNAIELAVETTPKSWPVPSGTEIKITLQAAEESIQQKVVLYDRDGDYHYDVISAFIKSIRGTDPDAALYWLARMVAAGENPHFIFRRLLISACEDIGLAMPDAISVVISCAEAFDRVGLPEGQYHLAHATLFLATCPKSNSSMGFFDALKSVARENTQVPKHLKDSSRDAAELGHGKGYLYPHAYRDHWVAQQYLPDNISGRVFYKPSQSGYEAGIADDVLSKREAQLAVIMQSDEMQGGQENIAEAKPESWAERTDTNRNEILEAVRDKLFEIAKINEYTRGLVYNADDSLLLWSLARLTPESITCGFCKTEKAVVLLSQYAKSLDLVAEPVLECIPNDGTENNLFCENEFDTIISWKPCKTKNEIARFFETIKNYMTEKTSLVFAIQDPSTGIYLSEYLSEVASGKLSSDNEFQNLIAKLHKTETDFFTSPDNELFNWSKSDIIAIAKQHNIELKTETIIFTENRTVTKQEISKWLGEKSPYGKALAKTHSPYEIKKLTSILELFAGKIAAFKIAINFFSSK